MSNPINDGGQAFPCPNPDFDGNWNKEHGLYGMSLLNYFAAAALQGLLANPGYKLFDAEEQTIGDLTDHAKRIAKIMLITRTKGGQDERA